MAITLRAGSVRANGLSFSTLEAGDGPLLLCLHGFPDHAYTFRHQLPALAEAGYRAVAPFMRGYAPTAAAPDGRYQSAVLAHDALALIEALGHDDAVVFGHDWGSIAACGAAVLAPQRIRKLITAAVPHGPGVINAFLNDYDQQRRSWYMFFFQTPFAENAVAHDNFRFIERLWQDWSPGWSCPAEEMAALKETFAKPGVLDAALAYYRCTLNPAKQDPSLAEFQATMSLMPIDVPTLAIHGARDGCMGVELLAGMEAFFPRGVQKLIVEDAGHFVHQEQRQLVTKAILDFVRAA
jgi:pimeloyl-ACP methyl ester carboxylesterase